MEISKVLITGVAGSGGSYLAEYIAEHHSKVEIHGLAYSRSTRLNLEAIGDKVVRHEADLMDFGSVFAVLNKVRPDAIFHLAAFANVRASFITPTTFLSNNILGTSNLFEAVRAVDLDPVIQLCSTSEVYGKLTPKMSPSRKTHP